MQKLKRNVTGLVAVLLALPLIMAVAWGMGKRPSEKNAVQQEAKQQRATGLSRKAQLAGMEGSSTKIIDGSDHFFDDWASNMYGNVVESCREAGKTEDIEMHLYRKKDVHIGSDSSYALVLEQDYYEIKEVGRVDGALRRDFIRGSAYTIDTFNRVLWHKEYDCGRNPLMNQELVIEGFNIGERYFVLEIPDTTKEVDVGLNNSTCVLIDKYGSEWKRFDEGNFINMSPEGKYLLLSLYDNKINGYKDLLYNLYTKDSIVVYGGSLQIEFNEKFIISPNNKRKKVIYKYNDKKGQIIDLR